MMDTPVERANVSDDQGIEQGIARIQKRDPRQDPKTFSSMEFISWL